jgi:uncharacterized membrane protein
MEAAFLFVIVIIGGVLALPIFALTSAAKAQSRAKRAEREAEQALRELAELRAEVEKARAHARAVDGRLSAWVAYLQSEPQQADPAPSPAPVSAPSTSLPRATPTPPPAPTPAASPPAPDVSAPALDTPAPAAAHSRYRDARARHAEPPAPHGQPPEPPPPHAPFDWERLVGVRLFAWLGGGALFLAAALFLHYSIQENLIAPPVRVAIGLGVGACGLLGGDRLRSKARVAAEAISGAGVAILYAALFAARVLYDLIPNSVAFGGMILVTVTAGIVAVRRNAFFVALLSLLGGMATPYLLSTGQDRPLVLFAYVALLSGGVVAVARLRSWPSLGLIGLVCSTVLFAGWASKYLVAERAPYALGAVAVVAALFAFVQVEGDVARDDGSASNPWSLQRLLVGAASLLPVGTAVILAGNVRLDVDPRVLAPYLLIVSAGAFLAERRQGSGYLTIVAGILATLALTLRVTPELFPERAALALGSFALVPLGFLATWLARRGKPEEPRLRAAAVITLLGALPVVFGAAHRDPGHEAFRLMLAYAWLHAGGLVAIGVLRREGWPFAAAQVVAFCSLVVLTRGDATSWKELVTATAGSGVLLWGLPLVHPYTRTDRMAWWAGAAALPLHFVLFYDLSHREWDGGPLGGVAVSCAVLTAISLRAAREHTGDDPKLRLALSALYGALTLGFVTASLPLLVENEWLTISWAVEVAALAWLRRRVPHGGLVLALAVLAAGVSVRLLANPALWEYHERSRTPILNYYLYTFGLSAVAFLTAQRLLRADELAGRFRLPGLLGLMAALLLFVLMNVEIADYYSTGSSVNFRLSGGGLAEDMTYSLAWGCFAIALLLVGMVTKDRSTRIGALVVLVLTVGKVFLHDLWELGSLYRVGSIVGLAVALLGVSFLTQRFVLPKEKT